MDVFEDAWRRARLQLSAVPPLLVRDWVQDAYTRACETRGWAFLRKEGSINILVARTVTVTFTQGSTTITSVGAFNTTTDPGRQIKVNSIPIYTIASVTDANTAILDQPYADVGGALTSTIFDAYFTCPTDFRRFIMIYDPYYLRIIPFWISQDELAIADPARRISESSQGPRYLVSQGYSTATATLGQVRYEYWPKPMVERHYPYLYYRAAERFTESSPLPGVFGTRSDVLKLGALLQAAEWPGTLDQKNPYFNLQHAIMLRQQWETELERLSLADDNEYPEDLMTIHWTRRYGALAPTASLLRQTDATVNDYF